ncbi:DegV family protein [Anaerococcus sp. mt242]|uniref:DegV family protein n=1 Tax=Anaerococcus sp. mt242 TaxID=2661917 RepID=UPI00193123DC|nr:DegV family protein [Anaerococcus sp. mt242]MBM0047008.1 DegV family protein [Anaerococcus sp. mt242]
MEKIALITDSGADLSEEFIKENNIYVANLYVVIDDQFYEDRVAINPADLNKKNNENSKFTAKTTSPSPADFSEVFKKVANDGFKKAIYVGLNPKLSSTFSNAELAEKHGLEIAMVNSGSVTLLEGLIVIYANDLIKEGFTFEKIVEKLNKNVGNQKAYVWFDTLKYLKAGGRLGKVAKRASSILNFKPVLSLDGQGDFDLIKLKVKKEKSYDIIEEKIREDLANVKKYYMTYISGTERSLLKDIKNRLEDIEENAESALTSQFGSAISAHAGSKAYSVGYLKIIE